MKVEACPSWRDHHIDWREAVRGVPTEDYLGEHDLSSPAGRHEAVEAVTFRLELRRWHAWEAVIYEEQELPLSSAHEQILDELLDFSEGDEDRVLYINDSARPREPWYATVRPLARSLRVSRYETWVGQHEGVLTDGEDLLLALEEHGEHLSLPPGAGTRYEAIGSELWDQLTLQVALDAFGGVGCGDSAVHHDHVDWFLRDLMARIGSVVALDACLNDVLAPLVLPPGERERLVRAVCRIVRIRDAAMPLAYPLGEVDLDEEWDESWPSPWDES